jgi:hypothetical protein
MQLDRRHPATTEPIARTARIGNAILGIWLFASAFLLPHTPWHRISDAAVGAVTAAVALAALYFRPQLRVINIALAVWLFVSLWAMRVHSVGTFVNDLLVSTLVFGLAVVPHEPGEVPSAYE